MTAALTGDLFEEIVSDGRHKLHSLLQLLNSSAITLRKTRKFQLPSEVQNEQIQQQFYYYTQ